MALAFFHSHLSEHRNYESSSSSSFSRRHTWSITTYLTTAILTMSYPPFFFESLLNSVPQDIQNDLCRFPALDEEIFIGSIASRPSLLHKDLDLQFDIASGSDAGGCGSDDVQQAQDSLVLPCKNLFPDVSELDITRYSELLKIGEESRWVAFRTKSALEMLDDGYKWRKYGKKMTKNSPSPRNYFRCATEDCFVKKRVEKDPEDGSFVITSYRGKHNHEARFPATNLCPTIRSPSSMSYLNASHGECAGSTLLISNSHMFEETPGSYLL